MSLIGFDIGNENCVIAGALTQGGVDVLLNEESNRETPAVICFGAKQRFMGSTGAACAMLNLKSTITQVKKLIGRRFKDPNVQTEIKRLPFDCCESPDGGIKINLTYLGRSQAFTPVEILGMLFTHLKNIAEKNLGPVAECVIGVPSYFTDLQKREYLNAATIAGLKPLRLINDCTATALGYGFYKTDFAEEGKTYVAFVDIGHCDTQVAIVSYETGHMTMLSHAFDSSLGGRDFDEVLFDHFAKKFKEEYSIDVYSNVKACVKLRYECEKLKKVLSANSEAPLNIECLMDEKYVQGLIKRDEFEELISELMERISVPCVQALADIEMNANKIHSVEIVGSGSRVPAITRVLTSIFGKEPRRTLNASESVARGCALQCAMSSPNSKSKEYEVQDFIPFTIGLLSDDAPNATESNANKLLFRKGQHLPSLEVRTYPRSSVFHLEAFYANPEELPAGVPPKISFFTISFNESFLMQFGPFKATYSEREKVKVEIVLNLNGIVTVESATLIEEVDVYDKVEHVDGEESNETTPKPSRPPIEAVVRDKDGKKIEISITESIYGGITKPELTKAQEREVQLLQQDKTMERTKEKKNALEAYVYEMRNKLFDTYRLYASDEEKNIISKSLQETEEWLYEDGDDETEKAYTTKMEELQKFVEPVDRRYADVEARVHATRDFLKCIVEHRMSVDSLPTVEQESIINECNKAELWLRDKISKQDALHRHSDPVLWAIDIRSRTEDLTLKFVHLFEEKTSPSAPLVPKNPSLEPPKEDKTSPESPREDKKTSLPEKEKSSPPEKEKNSSHEDNKSSPPEKEESSPRSPLNDSVQKE